MHALFSVAQIREIELSASQHLPPSTLMQRAGRATADAALAMLAAHPSPNVLVLAGPGNNGGDALEAAAHLAHAQVDVSVIHLAGQNAPAAETQEALAKARASDAQFVDEIPAEAPALVLDGLFGIGLARPLSGRARALAEAVNALRRPVLAIDVPSGLDADTGAAVGPQGVAIRATATLTFIGDKPGLHTNEGRTYAGTVHVAALELDPAQSLTPVACLSEPALFAHCLQARDPHTHKGSFGNVAIVGGARGMTGAPLLGARTALFSGAGRVYCAFVDPGPAFDAVQPEIMCRVAEDFDMASASLVLGPGMGNSPLATHLLMRALDAGAPVVLDADALNLVATSGDLQSRVRTHGRAILTPHPLEAARLLGMTAAIVQADRLEAARELASRYDATIVLKGSGTVIARGEQIVINTTGNPGLATAGTGDVLAGLCGSLLAQGWPNWEAALAAVWMHGAAADRLVLGGYGPIGLTAGELPGAIRAVYNALVTPGDRPRS